MREGQQLETKLSPPKKNRKEEKGGGKEEKVIRQLEKKEKAKSPIIFLLRCDRARQKGMIKRKVKINTGKDHTCL